jgi:hypothetical protein
MVEALSAAGVRVEPMSFTDEDVDVVSDRLLRLGVVLVWVDPLDGADTRTVLDAMLRRVSAAGRHRGMLRRAALTNAWGRP